MNETIWHSGGLVRSGLILQYKPRKYSSDVANLETVSCVMS